MHGDHELVAATASAAHGRPASAALAFAAFARETVSTSAIAISPSEFRQVK
jgi:hypothetical protein